MLQELFGRKYVLQRHTPRQGQYVDNCVFFCLCIVDSSVGVVWFALIYLSARANVDVIW